MQAARATVSFGQWLKERRKSLDLTQQEVARRIGCSHIAIRKIEAGERHPSRYMAGLLADLLQVPATERAAFLSFARGLDDQPKAPETVTAQRSPGNLPARRTSLIGREDIATEISLHLARDDVRLLTLTGPPGVGKTSLAVQVASRIISHFRDGVFFVPLAPVVEAVMVNAAIAKILGVAESGHSSLGESLIAFLHDKQILLLLDNFEQVVEAAPSVASILESCPGAKVMVTSREPLLAQGERVFRVPPLEVPSTEYQIPSNSESLSTRYSLLSSISSVALFVERAQALEPDFALTAQNAEAVAAICVRLEGLPLAIELAAARARMLTPQEIHAHLDGSLPALPGVIQASSGIKLLSGGPRDLSTRQQTLRGAIDWSYALLSEGERKLFDSLGIFRGGCALAAAEAICNKRGGGPEPAKEGAGVPFSVLEGLLSLLDKNLLKREEGVEGESCFTMLEMLRDYSLERLQASGRLPTLREDHARYYLGFAEEAGAQLDGEQQLLWLKRLDQAYENIHAAIAWSIENEVDAGMALRFAGALRSFWLRRGHVTDARNLLGAALARANETRSPEKAPALYVAGRLALLQGDYPAGQSLLSQSLDLYRELGDRTGMSMALNSLGTLYNRVGDFEQGRQALEGALAIAREIGDPKGIGEALGYLGSSIMEFGNHRDALPLFEESLSLARQAQDIGLTGSVLLTLGDIARLDGDSASARSTFEESVALFEASGGKMGRAFALANLAQVVLKDGDPTTAARLLNESVDLFQQIGHRRGLLQCLDGFAALHLLKGERARAISLLSAAEAAMDRNEAFLEKVDHVEFEKHLAEARELAGEAIWTSAWAEGQRMTMEQAIDHALEE